MPPNTAALNMTVCLELAWFTEHDLPDDLIPYPAAGLRGSLDDPGGLTFHNWPAGRRAASGATLPRRAGRPARRGAYPDRGCTTGPGACRVVDEISRG